MEWVETVRQIIESKGSSLTPQERQVLEKMKDFENIPRKKKKFENFLKNAFGRFVDSRTVEKVWSLLEAHKVDTSKKEEIKSKENAKSPSQVEEKEPEVEGKAEPEAEDAAQSSPKETEKLSKKEKKERKKKQKYELELESISKEKEALDCDKNLGEVDMELDEGENPEDESSGKKKKSKKKKDKVEDEQNVEESNEAAVANGNDKRGEKKKGKRKHNGHVEDEGGVKKKMKGGSVEEDEAVNEDAAVTQTDVNGDTGDEIKKKGKFKWDKTILAILEAVSEHELPVKRLRKKVLAEYQEAVAEGKCQELSFEESLGMFERKLHKIPGVKVHKEKAKLSKST
ncbi:cell growth-regulating nucleolar protein isoform X2 [Ischnura elegans]|nr:cell growth-regulating nucleolar protein isoform X2 [Ischnura elegans]